MRKELRPSYVSTESGDALGPEGLEMRPGEQVELTASPLNATGAAVEESVSWSSSDPAVVVAAGGFLTAGVPGVAAVRAIAGGAEESFSVSVAPDPAEEPGQMGGPDPPPVETQPTPVPDPPPLEDGTLLLTILPWGALYIDDVLIDDEAVGACGGGAHGRRTRPPR